jgi:NADH dehydrogenase
MTDEAAPVLVAGGTGRLGTLLVERLVARGRHVRVLTRDPQRAAHLPAAVEVVQGDVRRERDVERATAGAGVVVSAVHGFAGPGKVSPDCIDRLGNANIIASAERAGSDVILLSVVGASADHPMELFRAKHAAEQRLIGSTVPWTIVGAMAFLELWATIMGDSLRKSGKALVFGRGMNPINFVAVGDVAAYVELAVVDPARRGHRIDVGGPENVTFDDLAGRVARALGRPAQVRHIPRPMLRAMATLARPVSAVASRQASAALVMDTTDMTFDGSELRRLFPNHPLTSIDDALRRWASSTPSPVPD